ncbi:SAM-dependent methyltransferase [Paenibacillus popilliae]|uniref:Predicted methyltransferase n=1 Tax=Paenibacillus popilliae ATCC 14706 TaxID=1212764 RepID=M9L763_PAEPP|nr:SAM-dependent methyltransferase [Paenibacillus popilliae]GAC40717.1 predicted methyltransferase [Paenibacillus popilliae ATCC 14706]
MESVQELILESHFTPSSHWIVTSNHGYISYAQEELRRSFGQLKSRLLVPGEMALMELPAGSVEAIERWQQELPIFARHIQPVHLAVKHEEGLASGPAQELEAMCASWLERLSARSGLQAGVGTRVAVHVRSGGARIEEDKAIRESLLSVIERLGGEAVLAEPHVIVSVVMGEEAIYAGMMTPTEVGSDWPGGAMRFQREKGQISRAKFKLLEAERTFGLDYSAYRHALDVGAAPGGWTSLLLERGVDVTAIDPANMHPSLLGHPRLTYVKRNAADVPVEPNEFDLLVCDMSWSPKATAEMVIRLLDGVIAGGTILVTVKLIHKKPLQTIRDVTAIYAEHAQIIRAKQLFHNRDEITIYMMKY